MKLVPKSLKKIFAAAALAVPLAFSAGAFAADNPASADNTPQVTSISAQAPASGFDLGPLHVGSPLLLLGGVGALALLWYLMRTVPPKPTRHDFPAMRILQQMSSQDQEPSKVPWWQRTLRLTAAGLVVAGLAHMEFNPEQPIGGEGPVMLVVDNDWASAQNWEARTEEMDDIVNAAEREGRSIIVLSTAPPEDGSAVRMSGPLDADDARIYLRNLEPQPWLANRQAALDALSTLDTNGQASIIWLSNGLDDPGAMALAARLQTLGDLRVLQDPANETPFLLAPPDAAGDDLSVTVRRPNGDGEATLTLTASDEAGNALAETEVTFSDGQTQKSATFDLPPELRSQLTRVSIDGERGAGAVVLLDEHWRRRPVGLVDMGAINTAQPLLQEANYIEQALSPYVDLRQGSADKLLENPLAVMILPDAAGLSANAREKIDQWVKDGGTLLRFAGPRLAAKTDDNLLPTELRPGERHIESELSGSDRGKLAPFEEGSPFHGLPIPDGVEVDREVLAQPGVGLQEKTWAQLEDGTPLVTAKRDGKGWIVLVHTTANPDWSNLALSGLFVDMMRAVVEHSQGVIGGPDGAADIKLPPLMTLDGEGRLTAPPAAAHPLTREAIRNGDVSPQHPPGFYGYDSVRQAHNLATGVSDLKDLKDLPDGVKNDVYEDTDNQSNLSGPLLAGGLSLLLLDLLLLMGQQGMLPRAGGNGPRRKEPAPEGP